jgi:peptidoglycan/LPS O-acetylase OafA/YrhL
MRGLAALIVVFHHFRLVWEGGPLTLTFHEMFSASPWQRLAWAFRALPLRWLTAGPEAVVLFFVLSGFALHRMLSSAQSSIRRSGRWRRK